MRKNKKAKNLSKAVKTDKFTIIILIICVALFIFASISKDPQEKICTDNFEDYYPKWIELNCFQRSCSANVSLLAYNVFCKN